MSLNETTQVAGTPVATELALSYLRVVALTVAHRAAAPHWAWARDFVHQAQADATLASADWVVPFNAGMTAADLEHTRRTLAEAETEWHDGQRRRLRLDHINTDACLNLSVETRTQNEDLAAGYEQLCQVWQDHWAAFQGTEDYQKFTQISTLGECWLYLTEWSQERYWPALAKSRNQAGGGLTVYEWGAFGLSPLSHTGRPVFELHTVAETVNAGWWEQRNEFWAQHLPFFFIPYLKITDYLWANFSNLMQPEVPTVAHSLGVRLPPSESLLVPGQVAQFVVHNNQQTERLAEQIDKLREVIITTDINRRNAEQELGAQSSPLWLKADNVRRNFANALAYREVKLGQLERVAAGCNQK